MYVDRRAQIKACLTRATGTKNPPLTDGGVHADYASTVAFDLARARKMPPARIAGELAALLEADPELKPVVVTAKGPYLNFNVPLSDLQDALRNAVRPGYGTLPAKTDRIVLEHTSANPNGPLHVGHIRNSIIGDTLARCFRKAGYPLDVQYYVNDMGRQIAIVVWGIDRLESGETGNEKPDHHIARIYIQANRELEADPALSQGVEALMKLVEEGHAETVAKFRSAVSRCLDGFRVTMARLNVCHDRFVWESDFVRNGDTPRLIGRLKHLPQYRVEDEKVALDLSAEGFEKEYVLKRSDGTSVYAARDLAYHIWKGRNFDRIIDVLGADHKLIGAQLSATLRILGERPPEIVHFEFVSLPEGSMSTRAGKFVSADELMDEVARQAFSEVTTRRPELSEESRWEIAVAVAIGAIRYDIVKISPEKATVFDWKEALNFERQSGPYIQYAYARACSILEKAGEFEEAYELANEREIGVARQVAKFPVVIDSVVTELKPHLLAAYARELADLFNAFYHFEPVIKSEGTTRQSRLTLVKAVKNTLKEALETLGINAIRTM